MRSRLALYLDLIRWNRPAGWLLLLWPTLSALWIAADGFPGWHLLAVFVFGTVLMRSAGCCINDVADRDFDRHVAAHRAAAGDPRRTARAATRWRVGAVLALAAFALVLTTNAPTIALSFVALAITLAYPYAKRFVSTAAGSARRGLQLRHPDGLLRPCWAATSGRSTHCARRCPGRPGR